MMSDSPAAASNKKVLILEDEPDIADILKELCEDALPGSEIELLDNGSLGLAALKNKQRDLLITDMKLPGLASADLLMAIAALPASQIPKAVLVFSGHEDMDSLRKQFENAFKIEFVSKPCAPSFLLNVITKLLA